MSLQPIGTVRSCFGGKFGVPRQPGLCPSAWGELVFDEPFQTPEVVRGLEGFSHLWLIFGFHETADQGWKPTVRPPRLGGNQRVGVFASRSTFRPNGLGLSLVRLEHIDTSAPRGPVLHLGGLDLLDGTPVYDIKPYLPYAEAVPDAASGFAADPIPQLTIELSETATRDLAALSARARSLIHEALALDPRPAAGARTPERVFGALLCGRDVRFRVAGTTCTILEAPPAKEPPPSGA